LNSLVSIIIPTYNRAHLIHEALDSVLSQIRTNWECIVIDDGSADATAKLMERYKTNDSRFQYYNRPENLNKGASSCRNYGASLAKGQYLIFLDSDDQLLPNCLANRVENAKRFPDNLFWVFAMTKETLPNNFVDKTIPVKEDYLKEFLSYQLHWGIMCVLWDVNFFKKLNGFNANYPRLNDPELHIRAMLNANDKYKVFANQSPDCIYRFGGGAVGNTLHQNYFRSLLLFIPDMVVELKKYNKKEYIVYLRYYLLDYLITSYRFVGKKDNLKIFKIFKKNKVITSIPYFQIMVSYFFYIGEQFFKKKFRLNVLSQIKEY